LEKVFDFRQQVETLQDSRPRAQIPTASVWLCVFGMFVTRLRSLNRLEQELRRRHRWESWVGGRKPSADTVARTLSRMSLPELRQLLEGMVRQAWRNKAIHLRRGEAYRVVAIDGHEIFSSRARCCEDCLVREVKLRQETVLEYYHRVVVAQWVGVCPPAILDLEPVQPREGEVMAARRLAERVLRNYCRLVDVIVADALYLEAPFIQLVLDAGKHVVVVMKQEARELYQDAERLRSLIEPELLQDGERTTRLWDLPELDSFASLGQAVRVVWAEERRRKRKIVGGQLQEVVEETTWVWVTDLPGWLIPARKIQRWGHDRWDVENRGFNELVRLWHMDHCFVHHPTAMEALLLSLALAFVATYLFYERNLKPAVRLRLTRLALAHWLLEEFALLQGACVWSSEKGPG
jgi:hypothetical protein